MASSGTEIAAVRTTHVPRITNQLTGPCVVFSLLIRHSSLLRRNGIDGPEDCCLVKCDDVQFCGSLPTFLRTLFLIYFWFWDFCTVCDLRSVKMGPTAVSETSSANSRRTPCKNLQTQNQYPFHGESLKSGSCFLHDQCRQEKRVLHWTIILSDNYLLPLSVFSFIALM